ncbi:hypothetical protein [Lysinibacillus sp. G01H]|uniref:hypothetical protein n=1 Tax=Lysinibacillus sp. G01H TaxID=3026425 RepID=UPI00237D53CF|nr:hypothetical protein [Lysinibacillus sp. G01H]WDU81339.1 hypothetical protein PSR12_09250 [Lysinibacillus sp. G01H]
MTFGDKKEQKIIGFSLVENGADSIKNAHACIEKIDELVEGVDHTLKDAVIFLNHGIEILLKVMLEERNSVLLFKNIEKYQKAKIIMKKENKKDIFAADPELQTVTLKESLDRLEYICDVEINSKMKNAILELNKTRNRLMHSKLSLYEQEFYKQIDVLKLCYNAVCDFFNKHIKSFNIYMTEARFEFTKEEEREFYEAWSEAEKLPVFD